MSVQDHWCTYSHNVCNGIFHHFLPTPCCHTSHKHQRAWYKEREDASGQTEFFGENVNCRKTRVTAVVALHGPQVSLTTTHSQSSIAEAFRILDVPAPKFAKNEIAELACSHFGVTPQNIEAVKVLGSEKDQNFKVVLRPTASEPYVRPTPLQNTSSQTHRK